MGLLLRHHTLLAGLDILLNCNYPSIDHSCSKLHCNISQLISNHYQDMSTIRNRLLTCSTLGRWWRRGLGSDLISWVISNWARLSKDKDWKAKVSISEYYQRTSAIYMSTYRRRWAWSWARGFGWSFARIGCGNRLNIISRMREKR